MEIELTKTDIYKQTKKRQQLLTCKYMKNDGKTNTIDNKTPPANKLLKQETTRKSCINLNKGKKVKGKNHNKRSDHDRNFWGLFHHCSKNH